MLHLGVDPQDTALAMDLLTRYQETVKRPEKGILDSSQQNSGPCGIRDRETDWLTLENALPRASSPRRSIERRSNLYVKRPSLLLPNLFSYSFRFASNRRFAGLVRGLGCLADKPLFAVLPHYGRFVPCQGCCPNPLDALVHAGLVTGLNP